MLVQSEDAHLRSRNSVVEIHATQQSAGAGAPSKGVVTFLQVRIGPPPVPRASDRRRRLRYNRVELVPCRSIAVSRGLIQNVTHVLHPRARVLRALEAQE